MSLRDLERGSIRAFLESHADKLAGRVLDFGAGQQPYRDVVIKAGGDYTPWDDPHFAGSTVDVKHPYPTGQFDTVVCTQVLQYVDDPVTALEHMRYHLRNGGWLLLTGPTNWPVVEDTDKWRFTLHGAVLILLRAGFRNTTVEPRADVMFEGERWSLGWQASGQAL